MSHYFKKAMTGQALDRGDPSPMGEYLRSETDGGRFAVIGSYPYRNYSENRRYHTEARTGKTSGSWVSLTADSLFCLINMMLLAAIYYIHL